MWQGGCETVTLWLELTTENPDLDLNKGRDSEGALKRFIAKRGTEPDEGQFSNSVHAVTDPVAKL